MIRKTLRIANKSDPCFQGFEFDDEKTRDCFGTFADAVVTGFLYISRIFVALLKVLCR